MLPKNPNDLEVLHKSRVLLKMMYRVYREDAHLSQDYQLWIALQKPALGLIGKLANAAGSGQTNYFSNGVAFARSHCAEFRAILDSAQDVGAIEDEHHRDLQAKIVEIQTMLSSLSTALERRVVGL